MDELMIDRNRVRQMRTSGHGVAPDKCALLYDDAVTGKTIAHECELDAVEIGIKHLDTKVRAARSKLR